MPLSPISFKKHRFTLFLVILSLIGLLLTKIAPHFPYFIEHYYSQGINRLYRQLLSRFFGIFPFSVYEFLLYIAILILFVYTLYRLTCCMKRRSQRKKHLILWLLHISDFAMIIWCLIIYTWTLNYARVPLETTMQLESTPANNEALAHLYSHLIMRLNQTAHEVDRNKDGQMIIYSGYQSVFDKAPSCYDTLSKTYPVFGGDFGPPKSIALSKPMLYTSITGIYSPFTSEPNINTAILPQTLPVTTLHELAHQRGFAPEDEANFIATLAATVSEDATFRYSGYFLAYIYTNQELYRRSPESVAMLNKTLDPLVKQDLHTYSLFLKAHEGKIEKISSTLNDSYLKANGIADGEASYGRMVSLLLAYYQTHPNL